MVQRSGRMVLIALALVGITGWGLTRIPTGFIPTEDQGYVMVSVQLPDGASLQRTERVMDEVTRSAGKSPAWISAIAVGGISPLDNSASLANAGIVYLTLKDWSERGKSENLKNIYLGPVQATGATSGRQHDGAHSAADSGLGIVRRVPDAGGIDRRQLRLRPVATGRRCGGGGRPDPIPSSRRRSRRSAPRCRRFAVTVDRSQAETMDVPWAMSMTRCRRIWDRVTSTCSPGSATTSWSSRRPMRSTG